MTEEVCQQSEKVLEGCKKRRIVQSPNRSFVMIPVFEGQLLSYRQPVSVNIEVGGYTLCFGLALIVQHAFDDHLMIFVLTMI